jgi:putative transposase
MTHGLAVIAKLDTILAWHCKRVAQPCDGTQPRTSIGRPRIAKELENLVVRMAREKRS